LPGLLDLVALAGILQVVKSLFSVALFNRERKRKMIPRFRSQDGLLAG